jgi:uncharacterized protein YraI
MTLARTGLIAAVSLGVSVATASAKPTTVTAEVNLRDTPATSGKILALIPKGTSVEAATCTNGWCQVSFNGQQGYVIQRNLDVPQPPRARRHVARRSVPQVYAEEAPVVYDPGPVYVGPPYRYYGYYGPYYRGYWGPRWGFGWGGGWGFRHRW